MIKPDGTPSAIRLPWVSGTPASGEWRFAWTMYGNHSASPLVWSMKVTAGDPSGNLTSTQPVSVTVAARPAPPPQPLKPPAPKHP
jgi:hypothetical protein